MCSGLTVKAKFSDLCLILSHGAPLYIESRIATAMVKSLSMILTAKSSIKFLDVYKKMNIFLLVTFMD